MYWYPVFEAAGNEIPGLLVSGSLFWGRVFVVVRDNHKDVVKNKIKTTVAAVQCYHPKIIFLFFSHPVLTVYFAAMYKLVPVAVAEFVSGGAAADGR